MDDLEPEPAGKVVNEAAAGNTFMRVKSNLVQIGLLNY